MDISPAIMQQLQEAQAELATASTLPGPPVAGEASVSDTGVFSFGASGSGTAVHVLADHYFTSTSKVLWIYAENTWRYAPLTSDDEQGIAQVAFLADRVDGWWNDGNKVNLLRCWKTF